MLPCCHFGVDLRGIPAGGEEVIVRDLIKFIRKLEWASYAQGQGSGFMSSGGDGQLYPACPVCGGIKPGSGAEGDFMRSAIGHYRGCQMKEILKPAVKK